MNDKNETEKQEPPGLETESPSHEPIQADYVFPDFEDNSAVREMVKKMNERAKTVMEIIVVEKTDKEGLDSLTSALRELEKFLVAFWQKTNDLIKPLENHPFVDIPWSNERLTDPQKELAPVIKNLNERLYGLIFNHQEIIDLEKRLETIHADYTAKQQEDEAANARLCQEAQATVNELEKPLGLGFLPSTRRGRAEKLHQAKLILSFFKNSTLEQEDLTQLLNRTTRQEILERGGKIFDVKRQMEITEQELESKKQSRAVAFRSLKTDLTDFLKQSGGRADNSVSPLESFCSAVEQVETQAREKENRVNELFFQPLGITTEDEAAALSEPLPEGTIDAIKEARERSFKNLRETIRRFVAYYIEKGRTMEEIATDFQQHIERVRQTAFVSFNGRTEEISEILESGKILPKDLLPYEKKKHSATKDHAWQNRKQIEQELGFVHDEPPVYMAMASSIDKDEGAAPSFGAFHLAFSIEQLKSRAVCMLGDTLNESGLPYSLRDKSTALLGATKRQLTLEHGLFAKALLDLDSQYEPKDNSSSNFCRDLSFVEVQTPGPIRVSEAEELVLSRSQAVNEVEILTKIFRDAENMLQQLSRHIGRVRVSEIPPPNLNTLYNKGTYERFFKKPTRVAA